MVTLPHKAVRHRREEDKPRAGRGLVNLLLVAAVVWAVGPLLTVCVGLLAAVNWLEPLGGVLARPVVWFVATIVYAIATILVFGLPVVAPRGWLPAESRGEGHRGMLCTLAVGLPALLFGAITFAGPLHHVPAQLRPARAPYKLEEPSQATAAFERKRAHVFLVDVSGSYLSGSNDLGAIKEMMTLLADPGAPATATDGTARTFSVYLFATELTAVLGSVSAPVSGADLRAWLGADTLEQVAVRAAQRPGSAGGRNRDHTDLIHALRRLYLDSPAQTDEPRLTEVYVFSDMQQSMGSSPDLDRTEAQIDHLSGMLQQMDGSGPNGLRRRLQVTLIRGHDDPAEGQVFDLTPYLPSSLVVREGTDTCWRRVRLDDFLNRDQTGKTQFVEMMQLREYRSHRPLYLKIPPWPLASGPQQRARSTSPHGILRLPQGQYTATPLFSLRKIDPDAPELHLRLGKNSTALLTTGPGGPDTRTWPGKLTEGWDLVLRVERATSLLPQSGYELRIGYPDLGVVYVVPLVVANRLDRTLVWVCLILFFVMSLFAVVVAWETVRELWAHRDRRRQTNAEITRLFEDIEEAIELGSMNKEKVRTEIARHLGAIAVKDERMGWAEAFERCARDRRARKHLLGLLNRPERLRGP